MEAAPVVHQEPVIVNVYDMMAINDCTKLLGIGVFHTGVEVYGNEYAYGGHFSTFTGIYDMNPKDSLVLGDDFRYKCSFAIGYTPLTKEDIEHVISHLGRKYRGSSYSIVNNNCNHFTHDFCLMLCGRTIPRWINRLASIVRRLPYLGTYAERNMGIPHVLSQCCGSTAALAETSVSEDKASEEASISFSHERGIEVPTVKSNLRNQDSTLSTACTASSSESGGVCYYGSWRDRKCIEPPVVPV